MRKLILGLSLVLICAVAANAQIAGNGGAGTGGSGGGGAPSGAAGGDLGGTYPNPTVVKATGNGAAFTVSNAGIFNNPAGNNGGNDLQVGFDTANAESLIAMCTILNCSTSWQMFAEDAGSGDGNGTEFDLTNSASFFQTGFTAYGVDNTIRPSVFLMYGGHQDSPAPFATYAAKVPCQSSNAGHTSDGAHFWVTDALTNKLGDTVSVGGGTFHVGISCDGPNTAYKITETAQAPISAGTKGSLFASTTVSASAPAVVGCTDTTVAVTSATTSMTVAVSPQANPNGAGVVTWAGYISAAGTADVRVCAITVDTTPPAVTYNVLVLN